MNEMKRLQREVFFSLGGTLIEDYGSWLRNLRKTVEMDREIFWAAVQVSEKDGKEYESQKGRPPGTIMATVVYVHIMNLPMIFVNDDSQEDFRRRQPIIGSFIRARREVPREVRWRFLEGDKYKRRPDHAQEDLADD